MPGELRVFVLDSQEGPVFDAEVGLSSSTASLEKRSTRTTGVADFQRIPCGAWNVTATKEGFESKTQVVQIANGSNVGVRLILTPKMQVTSVEVTDSAPRVEQSASANNELHLAELKTLPTNPATVNDTLPLVPGVVRAQNGELKIDGTGQERSSMVVNHHGPCYRTLRTNHSRRQHRNGERAPDSVSRPIWPLHAERDRC